MTSGLLGLVAAISWGLHDFLGRFTTRSAGTNGTTLAVMLSGLALLTIALLALGRWPRASGAELALAAGSGIAYGLALYFLFAALKIGPLSIVSLIVGAYPATAVAIAIAQGAAPNALTWLAIAAVLTGMALLVLTGRGVTDAVAEVAPSLHRPYEAPLLAFGSHLAFAAAISLGQTLSATAGAIETAWLTRIAGLAVILLASMRPRLDFASMRASGGLLIFMGALDVLALGAILFAGGRADAHLAPVVSSGYGAVATLLGTVFLKERMTPPQWLGVALCVAGTAVLSAG